MQQQSHTDGVGGGHAPDIIKVCGGIEVDESYFSGMIIRYFDTEIDASDEIVPSCFAIK